MPMPFKPAKYRIVIAASLLCLVMGSIHAFSVFLTPLETTFGTSRGTVALTYSFALIAITLSVLAGPRIYTATYAHWIFFIAASLGGAGAILAAFAPSLWLVWLGYSLIFGIANGLAYGYGLQISAHVWPAREGIAMGCVTAAYALGSVLAPWVFEVAVKQGGFTTAMLVLLAALGLVACVSALLTWPCRVMFNPSGAIHAPRSIDTSKTAALWLAYCGGVLAGLMVIGHASAIAQQWSPALAAWVAPALIAGFNMLGCLATGRMIDQISPSLLLGALAITTSVVLVLLGLGVTSLGVLAPLAVIGFCYGGTISAYPAALIKQFGPQAGPRVFGKVFTAWGAAGLVGPWLAGRIFDVSGSYDLAILIASSASALSLGALVIAYGPQHRKRGDTAG